MLAEGIATLAVSETPEGHDLNWWDFSDEDVRVAVVVWHLRRIGVFRGQITEHGQLTG